MRSRERIRSRRLRGRSRARAHLLVAGALGCAIAWSGIAVAEGVTDTSRTTPTSPGRETERPDGDLLLLAIRLDQQDLDVTLGAWVREGAIRLPLGELAQALGLAIEVDPGQGLAQGFVIDPRRRFRLAKGSGTVLIDGAPRPLAAASVTWHDDDVYVDARRLEEWLPLDLVVERSTLTVSVRPRERLPIQQRHERARRAARALAGATPSVDRARLQAPYRALGWPASDLTLYAYRQSARSAARGGLQYTSLLGGDLLYMEGRGFLSGDDRDPFRQARFSLGRRDPDPVLLGPLHAREFALGDVLDPGLELVSLASAGPGALVSSVPLFEENEYDRRTFRGDLAPGWDVELLRNDALVGYRQSGTGGLYEFADVPLLYGVNVFRLQFHGPQGQSRSETRIVNVGRSLTPPGRIDYRVVAHQPAGGGAGRARGELAVGLSPQLSATARVAGLALEDGDHLYGGGGLRVGWERVFVKVDAVADTAGGHALQAAVATRLGPRLGLWSQHARLDRFRSEVFRPLFGDVRSRSVIRLDLEPGASDRPRIPTSVEWRWDRLEGGGRVDELTHQVSGAARGLRLSHRLQARWVRLTGPSPPTERRGALLVSRGLGTVAVRGAVEYELEQGGRLRDLGLVAETSRFGQRFVAGIRRGVQAREHGGYLSATRERGRWGMVVRSDYSSASGGGVSALLSFGLDRDPRSGRWSADALRGAESGAVSAQVFLDGNGNGRKDAAEEPIEGVRLRSSQSGAEARTGPDGVALLRGLPGGLEADFGLVESSLEDPLRITSRPSVTILPRAGSPVRVDFPIQLCGEVAGTVSLRHGNVTRPLGGARLELVSEPEGRRVKTARSAFDGYYDIAAIPPGRYRLRVAPPGPPRADVAPVAIVIEIGADGPILEPTDVELVEVTPEIAGEDGP